MRTAYPLTYAVIAAGLIGTLLAGCTQRVERPAVEVRHFAVDWEHSAISPLAMDGLTIQGIVLTPAQWPLEGSLKRLISGDFLGVVDALDLTFHSQSIPDGVLKDLYDAGYVPVYLRIANPGMQAHAFSPLRLRVTAEPQRELEPVEAEDVPYLLRHIDWDRTALSVVAALVIVAAIVSARENHAERLIPTDLRGIDIALHAGAGANPDGSPPPDESRAGYSVDYRPADPGLLRAQMVAPGETREGIVFFSHRGQIVDWPSARLAVQ